MNGPDDGLAGFFVDLMERLGLLGAAIAVGADNLFPPIPSEIVLPMAVTASSWPTRPRAALKESHDDVASSRDRWRALRADRR